jgi:DNA modification methylase
MNTTGNEGVIVGDSLDLIMVESGKFDLVCTDPPYAFGGSGGEHALSATVAIVLREAAKRLRRGGWMVVFAASSWRSTAYMVEAVRGVVDPVRIATWVKPNATSKTRTPGWRWSSVNVIAFRKGKSANIEPCSLPDYIEAAPLKVGRRAQLPVEVASWAVAPFAVAGGRMLDPFAGSGALVRAARQAGMEAIGYELTG